MSLSCSPVVTTSTVHLLKEGGADTTRHMDPGPVIGGGGPCEHHPGGGLQMLVLPAPSPVWSHPSDPLHLKVSGEGTHLMLGPSSVLGPK